MPFGDNTRTYRVLVDRKDWEAGQRPIRTRGARVPEAEPPAWWSEYLLAAWQRDRGLGLQGGQVSPGRLADERYNRECLLAEALYPQLYPLHQPQPPLHRIWETTDGRAQSG